MLITDLITDLALDRYRSSMTVLILRRLGGLVYVAPSQLD